MSTRLHVTPNRFCILYLFFAILFAPQAKSQETAQFEEDSQLAKLQSQFADVVGSFLHTHCLDCHNSDEPEGMLDLSVYQSAADVVRGFATWELVAQRVKAGEMPPEEADNPPGRTTRSEFLSWIAQLQADYAARHAGDPGEVLAHRLSSAEYNYTIRDLTGVDIQPAKEFPIDPANEAGFDNSGESLNMTPALLNKYLDAARSVAEHLLFKPDGLDFAPFAVVTDTDRDKYCVRQIINFYQQQNTNLADYFFAAWQLQRAGQVDNAKLTELAARQGLSVNYLRTIYELLTSADDHAGPIEKLRSMFAALPDDAAEAQACTRKMSEYVTELRGRLAFDFPHLQVSGMNRGSQTLVLWRNRQMASHRMSLNRQALREEPEPEIDKVGVGQQSAAVLPEEQPTEINLVQEPNELKRTEIAEKINEKEVVTEKANVRFAKNRNLQRTAELTSPMESQPAEFPEELFLPRDASERSRRLAALSLFCKVFPDRFYVDRRGRAYVENKNKGQEEEDVRLLSAGFHSMMGYFRDDQPLCELLLSSGQRRELDRLWFELDFIADAPFRQHTGFIWFERAEGRFLVDEEFDAFRSEDKSVTQEAMIHGLREVFLAKAERQGATERELRAMRDYFENINAGIRRVEQQWPTAKEAQLAALPGLAERAYRRPLSEAERRDLIEFYHELMQVDGLEHEDAVRDVVVSMLMSPNFCYRSHGSRSEESILPLSDYALASRLSYFLWSSMPDEQLLSLASQNRLHEPEVLSAQAARMLRDPKVRGLAVEFGGNWLGFRQFESHNSVDRERFPEFDNELRQSMFEEPVRFTMDVMQRNGSVLDFLFADHTFVNATLATHYGIRSKLQFDDQGWTRISHAQQIGRGGVLPMSVFMTKHAPGLRTSPVKRGFWVVRQLLGEHIPAPPPNVPELPNDESQLGEMTLRDVLARHRDHESCAGCHEKFDSMGLVFEGYGPIGERRELDLAGNSVDNSADFPDGITREGVSGLQEYLRGQRQDDFLETLCRKFLAYALGRTLNLSDSQLIGQMRRAVSENEYRFETLVQTIILSPQFLNQRGSASESER